MLKAEIASALSFLSTDYDQAETLMRQLVAENADSFEAHFHLAFLYSRVKRHHEAIEELLTARRLNPRSALVAFNLGWCHMELDDLPKARGLFDEAYSLSADGNSDAQVLAAMCQHRLGQSPDAIRLLRQTVQREPDHLIANFCLIRALREQDAREEADNLARHVKRILDRATDGHMNLLMFCNQYDSPQWDRVDNKASLKECLDVCRSIEPNATDQFAPPTFTMPHNYSELMRAHEAAGESKPWWIAKRSSYFGGHGMRILLSPLDAPREEGWVVQRYISDPFLVCDRKFDLRLSILITSVRPLRAYLYRDGLVRFAVSPYQLDAETANQLSKHATNYARFSADAERATEANGILGASGGIWSLTKLWTHLESRGHNAIELWARLESMGRQILHVCATNDLFARQSPRGAEYASPPKVLGFDVCLDRSLTPWLLEIERGPGAKGMQLLGDGRGEFFKNVSRMTVIEAHTREMEGPAELRHLGRFVPLDL